MTRERYPLPFGRYTLLESLDGEGLLTRARIAPLPSSREPLLEREEARGVGESIALYRLPQALLEEAWHEGSRPPQADEFVRRFERLRRCVPLQGEENLTALFELGELDGYRFVAMELLEAVEVAELMRSPLPLAVALFVAAEVAHALAALHGRSIAHPLVCPSEILIASNGRTVLSGLLPRFLKGRLRWLSPESLRGEAEDPRSDLFSLGLVLFRLVMGQYVVEADTDYDSIVGMQNWSGPPPSIFREDVPAEVSRIVNRLLAAQPAQRYPTAGELERDLRAELDRTSPGFGASDLVAYVAPLALRKSFALP